MPNRSKARRASRTRKASTGAPFERAGTGIAGDLGAWLARSRAFAMALVRSGKVSTRTPAFEDLAGGDGALLSWRFPDAGVVPFPTLEDAVVDACCGMTGDRRSVDLVRIGDDRRVQLELERTGDAILVFARDRDGAFRSSQKEHEVRNHLNAALLQMRLLQMHKTEKTAKHLDAVQSLLQQVVELLGSG